MSVNKVIIVGNLGADPEVRSFPDGGMVANVSVATTERWNDRNGQRQEHTEWHRVSFNGRLAEIVQQYLRKGSKIYVEGSIRTRKWQDQNGQDRYSTEVRGQTMQMLDSRNMDGGQGGYQNNPQGMPNQSYQNNNFNNNSFNQSNQMAGNGFANQPPQQSNHQPMQQISQPPVNPTAPAMSDAPADDDIPF